MLDDIGELPELRPVFRGRPDPRCRFRVDLGVGTLADRPYLAYIDGLVIDDPVDDPPGIRADDQLPVSG